MSLRNYLFLFLVFLFVCSVVHAGPKSNKIKTGKPTVCSTTNEYNVGDRGPYGWVIYKKELAPDPSEGPCWRYIEVAPDDSIKPEQVGKAGEAIPSWPWIEAQVYKKLKTSKEIGKGRENTENIINQILEEDEESKKDKNRKIAEDIQSSTKSPAPSKSAALGCKNYFPKDYPETKGEWFLPSKNELNLMYDVLVNKGGNKANFRTEIKELVLSGGKTQTIENYTYYWSSSDLSSTQAFFQTFEGGDSWWDTKETLKNIRCVRYF